MALRPVLIDVAVGKERAALSPGTTVTEDISALEGTGQSLGRGGKKGACCTYFFPADQPLGDSAPLLKCERL